MEVSTCISTLTKVELGTVSFGLERTSGEEIKALVNFNPSSFTKDNPVPYVFEEKYSGEEYKIKVTAYIYESEHLNHLLNNTNAKDAICVISERCPIPAENLPAYKKIEEVNAEVFSELIDLEDTANTLTDYISDANLAGLNIAIFKEYLEQEFNIEVTHAK